MHRGPQLAFLMAASLPLVFCAPFAPALAADSTHEYEMNLRSGKNLEITLPAETGQSATVVEVNIREWLCLGTPTSGLSPSTAAASRIFAYRLLSSELIKIAPGQEAAMRALYARVARSARQPVGIPVGLPNGIGRSEFPELKTPEVFKRELLRFADLELKRLAQPSEKFWQLDRAAKRVRLELKPHAEQRHSVNHCYTPGDLKKLQTLQISALQTLKQRLSVQLDQQAKLLEQLRQLKNLERQSEQRAAPDTIQLKEISQ